LLVTKDGMLLDARQLSDGERGLLALVLDLAKRLSQANPGLSDPVKLGEAVVLIDELDLHLHPKWQRTIVERLTKVFPRCQFIATTLPQIVAAVEPSKCSLTAAGVAGRSHAGHGFQLDSAAPDGGRRSPGERGEGNPVCRSAD
jgi:predicted ATP-binding protein involved in virulence